LNLVSLSPELPLTVIHVVAGALLDDKGRVLIAQRPLGKHLAGGWEFPGGKLEPGEDRRAGLARELREELGISIASPRPLLRLRHAYPEREVLLDVWVVRHFGGGEARGLDGQALRWCTQDELATADLLPADGPIVRALRLPEQLIEASTADYAVQALRPAEQRLGEPRRESRLQGALCSSLADAETAQRAGADFVVLREWCAPTEIAQLCALISVPVYARFQRGIALEETWALGATGTHQLSEGLA
jgi:8-oxo-dGTP diphosphatase